MSNQRLIPLIGAMLLALCVNTSASANTPSPFSDPKSITNIREATEKVHKAKNDERAQLAATKVESKSNSPQNPKKTKKSNKAKQTTKAKKSNKANRRHACELGYVRYGRTCIPAK